MSGYAENRALFTDFYQLTMTQGYHKLGLLNKKATFELFFRSNPFKSGFAIACGIPIALEYLDNLQFTSSDIEYLEKQNIFTKEYLSHLEALRFTGTVEGVPEGSVVFPYVPIIRVTASLIQAQLVETALLNIINYSTLIATKAARICRSARGGRVVDFGLRRAQGDGAYIGTRAALVGGCVGTSFVQAGKIWNCPTSGTQAHSWVQAFDNELDSFYAYSEVFPDSCLLLIDTYNVLKSGLPNAIKVAKHLEEKDKTILGVRIDSGDLAYLTVEVYREFKKEGFPDINIVLSNELDEYLIESIVQQIRNDGKDQSEEEKKLREDTINHLLYGVGTKLITGGQGSSLGGVYKLVALDGEPKIKVSENVAKTIDPGIKQVWRITDRSDGYFLADVMGLSDEKTPESSEWIYHPIDPLKNYQLPDNITVKPLYNIFMKDGEMLLEHSPGDWRKSQQYCREQLKQLHPTHQRLLNPHAYKVSLTKKLFDLKIKLIEAYTKYPVN
ncbi:MAG: nicotinate phosphoribosyltransferase [Candidatus Hodarchaeales archaeon]